MASARNLADRTGGVDIDAWTEQARAALRTTILPSRPLASPRSVRGTSVTLDIPLDAELVPTRSAAEAGHARDAEGDEQLQSAFPRRRELLRRDSLKKREALLKGKEGSRRRRQWENDRLMGNPWAQPPMPQDWEVRPTYPVHSVPYFLAPLWDERQAALRRPGVDPLASEAASGRDQAANITKELRQRLKRAKGARGLLYDLEEQVRKFLVMWEKRGRELEEEGLADVDSSEDEEIVFVGRNGTMKDLQFAKDQEKELRRDKLIFDSLVDDHGASFGRWLVHSIATYYNLMSWSVTTAGTPARRQAFVGIDGCRFSAGGSLDAEASLPRPLWGMV